MVKIAVIGLGRFGMSLARNLQKNGAQVIAIDRNINLVNEGTFENSPPIYRWDPIPTNR